MAPHMCVSVMFFIQSYIYTIISDKSNEEFYINQFSNFQFHKHFLHKEIEKNLFCYKHVTNFHTTFDIYDTCALSNLK